MSNEELDRRMEFIIEQQAQFASDIIQLREAQAKTAQIIDRTSQVVAETGQVVAETSQVVAQTGEIVTRLARGTLEGFKDVNAKINALVDSRIRTDEQFRRTDEQFRRTDERFSDVNDKIKVLFDSQIRTDEQFRRTDERIRDVNDKIKVLFDSQDPH